MNTQTEPFVPIRKDPDNQQPIPSAWRPVFSAIVNAFVDGDYALSTGIAGVAAVSDDTANHIRAYISDYGETLIPLPEATWDSSVCLWMESHWDVLIDLWTAGEGQSDLVLGARVLEHDDGHLIEVGMVYVP